MKPLASLLLWLLPVPVLASTYTVAAPHLTMHQGDPLPPLIFTLSPYPASYAGAMSGEPKRSTSVTPASPPGDYPIHISRGSLRLIDGHDSLHFADGVLTVLPPGPTGARLVDGIDYPPGFLSGPPPYSALDVTHNAIANLVPDCMTDNAVAFERLLSQDGLRTAATTNGGAMPLLLYFPPGCYATSRPLSLYGNTWTLWGSGPQSSYIRLLPNSPGFQTSTPVPFFDPHSVTKNSNFRESIYNLGFNIGVGNPGAIPFVTVQNNSGAVRNVQVWADDSQCPAAIGFDRQYPGPLLFKNVAIYGCQTAYSSSLNEYSITIENFTTEAQTRTGLDNHFLTASIRHWLSDNAVQALHVYGGASANVAVLDSELLGGDAETAAVAVDQGSAVYVSGITVRGYGSIGIDAGDAIHGMRNGSIVQSWTGPAHSLFNAVQQPDSLHLPVREAPEPVDPPVRQWVRLDSDVTRWQEQVEHAASPAIYAPPGLYAASGSVRVTVPDSVRHLQFYQSKFSNGVPQIILTVSGSSPVPLIIDSCPYESCQIVHTGRRAIVLRDTTLNSYESQQGAGDLYIEDSMLSMGSRGGPSLVLYSSQHLWAWQLNLEQRTREKLRCEGCTLWILGYKTEQPSPALVLTAHARAEVFGFFYYMNVAPPVAGSASMQITDSSLFAFGWTKVDYKGRGHPNWVIEEQNARSSTLATHDIDSSQQLPVFYSFGADLPAKVAVHAFNHSAAPASPAGQASGP